jgi:hypothetical protein
VKLIFHIIGKDARRFWPLVLLWSVLTTAYWFINWRVHHTVFDGTESLPRLKFFELLVFVVQLLTTYVFTATLVLEDSPVGTSTFWPTRPIAGVRLLAAKSLACALWFGALALLLSLPWWVAADVGQTELYWLSATVLCQQAGLVLSAFVVAAFAGTLEKFLVWTLGYGLLAGATVWGVAGTSHVAETFSRWDPVAIVSSRTNQINAAGAAIALLIQYHTRRRKIALGGFLALGAVMFVLDIT